MTMVGIVIVSHSARLAEGVVELARGMSAAAPVVGVGGLDLPDRPLGTDAALIEQAIRQVYSDAGVLVLMDLGSAILSAEFARDSLPEDWHARVVLCEAPLVEGAVAAATQAGLGSPLAQVLAEARTALAPKQEHLAPPSAPAAGPAAVPGPSAEQQLILTVPNRLGLHARPAARLVQTAGRFQAVIQVSNQSNSRGPANAKSLNGVATLGARQGHVLLITAAGPEAAAALAALQHLAAENFGDSDEPPAVPSSSTSQPAALPSSGVPGPASVFAGLPAAPGLALGPARRLRAAALEVPDTRVAEPELAWDALRAALDETRREIEAVLNEVRARAAAAAAEIFQAHLLFLDDEALSEPARRLIFEARLHPAAAYLRACAAAAAQFRTLEDEYQRARAADVEAVGRQVAAHVLGVTLQVALAGPGILVAEDLTPADTARLDPALVLGIATAQGGPTSHSSILARNLGLPAVVGLGAAVLALAEGTPVILDGDAGRVFPAPAPEVWAAYTQRQAAAQAAAAEARAASAAPAVTRDGQRIEIVANIGSTQDARAAAAAGAEGAGLFRTEFLFLDRPTAPDEDEQYAAYRAAAEALGPGRPVILRTLDVGGDKPLPYVDMDREANPFLGWRAVRLCLARPEFFKVQLRAVARVAAEFPVKVMFPMIATVAEFRAARELLGQAIAEVRAAGRPAPEQVETGIMVEIPAAALRAAQFAPEVAFFSIGTNDLTQYTLAAERGNVRVAALADACHPAVLDLIARTAAAGRAHGKWTGVCGELAGDPRAAPLLLGLGVTELSMAAPAIPRVKQVVRALDLAEAQALAQRALAAESAEAVRALLTENRPQSPGDTERI